MAMTPMEFSNLRQGDVVRNDATRQTYVIMQGTGNGYFVAARLIHVSDPTEWTRMAQSIYVPIRET